MCVDRPDGLITLRFLLRLPRRRFCGYPPRRRRLLAGAITSTAGSLVSPLASW